MIRWDYPREYLQILSREELIRMLNAKRQAGPIGSPLSADYEESLMRGPKAELIDLILE